MSEFRRFGGVCTLSGVENLRDTCYADRAVTTANTGMAGLNFRRFTAQNVITILNQSPCAEQSQEIGRICEEIVYVL